MEKRLKTFDMSKHRSARYLLLRDSKLALAASHSGTKASVPRKMAARRWSKNEPQSPYQPFSTSFLFYPSQKL